MRSTVGLFILASVSLFAVAQVSSQRTFSKAEPAAKHSSKQVPSFKSRSELVMVPVIVRKSGEAVSGLTKEQFEVLDEGRKRTISVFEEVKSNTNATPVGMSSKTHFSNHFSSDEGARRVTIILLDFLNTDAKDQPRARQAVIDYLGKSLQPDEPTALLVLTGDGLHELHSFSTSTATLIAAIRQARSGSPDRQGATDAAGDSTQADSQQSDTGSAALAKDIRDLQSGAALLPQWALAGEQIMKSLKEYGIQLDTMRAFEMISQAYAGIPGRKSLVWMTAGVWMRYPNWDVSHTRAHNDKALRDYTANLWRMLNASNIAVYPIDIEGLGYTRINILTASTPTANIKPRDLRMDFPESMTDAEEGSVGKTFGSSRKSEEARDTYKLYAGATGGRTCIDDNDLKDCLERAAKDSQQFYMLGFYVSAEDRKPGWHKLTVKLNAKYADLRFRNGYLVDDRGDGRPPIATDPQSLLAAYASPVDYTSLPMDVTVTGTRTTLAGDKRKLGFEIALAPSAFVIDRENNNHVELEISARAYDVHDKKAAELTKTVQANLKPESVTLLSTEGLTHRDALELAPGKYQLKIVVRDRLTGKMGSVTAPVEVM